jgi:hypothetical protein
MAQTYYMSLPKRSRRDVLDAAQGLITQNFDRQLANANQVLVDGTAYFMAVGLRANDLVSNISIAVGTAGSAVTLSKVGLYKKDGTRLAVSADQGTAWQSVGVKTIALASPYTVPVDDGYYVAVVSKATTTLPALVRAQNGLQMGAVGSGMAPAGVLAAQTDLPASATLSVFSTFGLWVAVS